MSRDITQQELKALLRYDPATGKFFRLVRTSNSIKVGETAGSIDVYGHRVISLNGRSWRAGRLAFLYMTGRLPQGDVDHKNRDRADDSWGNLREATRSQNLANKLKSASNTSGLKGVSRLPSGRWRASMSINNKHALLGVYDCRAAAYLAYVVETHKVHGEFARA